MEWLLLLMVVMAVAMIVIAPSWRGQAATRLEGVRGQVRRSIGRWNARDMQRAAARVVAREAMVSLTGAFLWDRVAIALAPEDHARIAPFMREFTADIEQLIRELAERPPARAEVTRYKLVSDPRVTVTSDASVLPGSQKVTGHVSGRRRIDAVDDPRERVTSQVKPPRGTVRATPRTRPSSCLDRPARAPVLWIDGRTVQLRDGMIIGRATEADVQLSDERVSRRHAAVHLDEDTVAIEDLGSANGTRVNGRQIDAKVELSSGDMISFGGTQAGRIAYDEATRLVA